MRIVRWMQGESVRRTEAYSRAASGGVEPAGVVVLGMEPDVEDLIDLSPHGAPGVPNANGYGRLSFNGSRPASPGPVSPRPVV